MNNIIRCTNEKIGSLKMTELLFTKLLKEESAKEINPFVLVVDTEPTVYNLLKGRSCFYLQLVAITKDTEYIKSVIRYLVSICNDRMKLLNVNNCITVEQFNKLFNKKIHPIVLLLNMSQETKDIQNLIYYLDKNKFKSGIQIIKTEVGLKFKTDSSLLSIKESSIKKISEQDIGNLLTDKNLTDKYLDEYIPTDKDFHDMDGIRGKYSNKGQCVIFFGIRCLYSADITHTNVMFTTKDKSKLAIISDSQKTLMRYENIIRMNITKDSRVAINIKYIRNDKEMWKLQDNKDFQNQNHIILVNTNYIHKGNLEYVEECYDNRICAYEEHVLHVGLKVEKFKPYKLSKEYEPIKQLVKRSERYEQNL